MIKFNQMWCYWIIHVFLSPQHSYDIVLSSPTYGLLQGQTTMWCGLVILLVVLIDEENLHMYRFQFRQTMWRRGKRRPSLFFGLRLRRRPLCKSAVKSFAVYQQHSWKQWMLHITGRCCRGQYNAPPIKSPLPLPFKSSSNGCYNLSQLLVGRMDGSGCATEVDENSVRGVRCKMTQTIIKDIRLCPERRTHIF